MADSREIKEKTKEKRDKKIIVIIACAVALIIAPFFAAFIADKYAVARVDKALSALKDDCFTIYDSAGYNMWTGRFHLVNFSVICLGEEAAKFDSIDFTGVKFDNDIPVVMTAEFDNAVFNADAKIFGRWGEIASKIGVTAVNNRGEAFYDISGDNASLIFTINGENVGVMAGTINVPQGGAAGETDFIKIAEKILVSKGAQIDVTFSDNGFLDMVMARYAAAIGTDSSVKAFDRALNGIEKRINAMVKKAPGSEEKLAQIYRFIQDPSEINLRTSQEDGLSITDIYESLDYSGWKSFANSFNDFKPKITVK